MADVPSYAVRDGRADSLDLGALLGNDSLSTALNARFTGSLSGTTLDSLLARLQLELLPSRVNDAELGPGRLTVGLDRGTLEGDLRLQGEDAAATASFKGRVGAEESRVRADGDLRLERLARWTGDTSADGRLEGRFGLDVAADSSGLAALGGQVTAVGGSAVYDCSSSTRRSARRPGPSSWTRWSCDPTRSCSTAAAVSPSARVRAPRGTRSGSPDARETSPRSPCSRAPTRWSWTPPCSISRSRGLRSAERSKATPTPSGCSMPAPWPSGSPPRVRRRWTAPARARSPGGCGSSAPPSASCRFTTSTSPPATTRSSRSRAPSTSTTTSASHSTWRGARAATAPSRPSGGSTSARDGANGDSRGPPASRLRPDVVEVRGFTLGAGDRSIALDGIFARRDSSDMTMRITGFDLDALEEARLVPIAGRLDGTLKLSGPAEAPSLEGKVGLDVRERGAEEPGADRVGAVVDPGGASGRRHGRPYRRVGD